MDWGQFDHCDRIHVYEVRSAPRNSLGKRAFSAEKLKTVLEEVDPFDDSNLLPHEDDNSADESVDI